MESHINCIVSGVHFLFAVYVSIMFGGETGPKCNTMWRLDLIKEKTDKKLNRHQRIEEVLTS